MMEYLIILLIVIICCIIGITYYISDKQKPQLQIEEPIPTEFDKTRRYMEMSFKHVDPIDNTLDEVTYLFSGESDVEELYERINAGLVVLGYSDKCLENYLGVEEE